MEDLQYLFQIQMKYYSFLTKNITNAKLLCQKKIRIRMEKGILETKLTGKKARKLSKRRDKIEIVIEGSRGNFTEGKFAQVGTSSGYQNNLTWHFAMEKKHNHWE
jgi:hypothetical protein